MSYLAQYQLSVDGNFTSRMVACVTQQAAVFKDDQRPSYVSTAEAVLRYDQDIINCFVRLGAAGPGIADKADNGDGTVNSENVTDGDMLSLTQASWPAVSVLYFNEDGTPIGG
jgi:hypothetical protein